MARVAVEGGAAFGPAAAGAQVGADAKFSPNNAAGWAFYWALIAAAVILLIAYSSSRG